MKAMNAAIEALNEIEAVWQEAYSFEFVDDVARKMAPRIFDHIRRHLKLRLEQYEIDVEQLRQAAAAGLEALVGIDTDEYGDPNNGPTGYREEREALQTVLAAFHPEAITPQPTEVCENCEGLGWTFVDILGAGTFKRKCPVCGGTGKKGGKADD